MPNFLSAALGVGNAVRVAGKDGLFTPSGFQGAFTAGLSSTDIGSAAAPLGLGALGLPGVLGGKGTRPKALHTEFAQEDANWGKPYGMGTDIVFYLQRADQTSSISDTTNNFGGDLSKGGQGNFNGQADSLTTGALPTNVGGVEPSRIPSNVQAGPNTFLKSVQSPLGQIASAAAVATLQGFSGQNRYAAIAAAAVPTAVGFLSNFNKNLEVGSGQGNDLRWSADDRFTNALNLGKGKRFTANYPASAKYWSEITDNAFNTDPEVEGFKVPTAELSRELSSASGGINSSQFLAESATDGKSLFTSPAGFASTALNFGDAIKSGFNLGSIGTLNQIPSEWYFITSPQDVSWSKGSQSKELPTYGSNNPYVTYGSTKLRKLRLGNAMVEGFSDSKAIENNIQSLEQCMKMVLNAGSGFTSPYCWKVFAGGKCYGTYLITSVSVREAMRDMSGHATRAFVDIELQEVPSYQVSDGTDLATKVMTSSLGVAAQRLIAQQVAQATAEESNRRPRGGIASYQDATIRREFERRFGKQ